MLKETDFIWLMHHVNNNADNPIDCCYCIIDHGTGNGRMYVVEPLYPQDTKGMVKMEVGYKYFVFFDCSVRLANADDKMQPFHHSVTYSGYVVISKTMIAVFDTMADAKKRAYTQYTHHFGYVMPYVVCDVDRECQKHFVVVE